MKKPISHPPVFISDAKYKRKEHKTAGRKGAGEKGGIYRYRDGDVKHKLMIKCETNKNGIVQPHKVIAEYLGAEIVGALVPDAVPQTYLVSAMEGVGKPVPDNVGDQVYLASVFFDKYKSFSEIGLHVEDADRMAGQETIGFSKARMRRQLYQYDPKLGYTESYYPKFDELIGVSVLINDFDVISTNIGATPIELKYTDIIDKFGKPVRLATYQQDKTGLTHTVRLDFGEGLGKLEDEVHIHSHTRHPFGFGPTNHVREIPRSVKVSDHFADALAGICSDENRKNLYQAIDRGINNASKFYDVAPIRAFAIHAGFKDAVKCVTKSELVTQLKGYLNAKMERRMNSLSQLEMEIRLSLCFERKPGILPRFKLKPKSTDPEKLNSKSLAELMEKDPLYFLKGNFHFRKKDQRFNLGVFKYRYTSLQKKMLTILNKRDENGQTQINKFISEAIKGRPEILEALELNKKIPADSSLTDDDYIDSVLAFGARLLGSKRRAIDIRNHIIEEILLEKSLPHRLKIIDRYLILYEQCEGNDNYIEDNRKLLQRAIDAALHNPGIRRLTKTPKQVAFYADQQLKRSVNPPPANKRRINPVMQAKWLQMSEGCESTSMLAGLVGKESRLYSHHRRSAEPNSMRVATAANAKA